MELKVKDFAIQMGVTDSIIYRHIRNNRDKLGDGVQKRGKSTWLNDAAQAFIKDLMIKQPYPVSDTGVVQRIYELEQENKRLLQDLADERGKSRDLYEKAGRLLYLEESNRNKDEQIASQNVQIGSILTEKAALDKKVAELEDALKQANFALENEINRPLTFSERISGRKQG